MVLCSNKDTQHVSNIRSSMLKMPYGIMLHLWWSCSLLHCIWTAVYAEIFLILGVFVPFTPECLLLHIVPLKNKVLLTLLNNMLVAAKILVARNWQSQTIRATLHEWRVKCHNLLLMNKITAIKRIKNGSDLAMQTFVNTWSKFIVY